jgi:hypothetical protein
MNRAESTRVPFNKKKIVSRMDKHFKTLIMTLNPFVRIYQ